MAKTDQEAGTVANHVTDVCVPTQMTVKQHAKVFDCPALPNSPTTDPYADRGEVTGVLTGAEEKDFSFGRVEF